MCFAWLTIRRLSHVIKISNSLTYTHFDAEIFVIRGCFSNLACSINSFVLFQALESIKCFSRLCGDDNVKVMIDAECQKLSDIWKTPEFQVSASLYVRHCMDDFLWDIYKIEPLKTQKYLTIPLFGISFSFDFFFPTHLCSSNFCITS